MKKISIIILIINLLLFWWKYFDIKLAKIPIVSNYEYLSNYLPLALFILTLLLFGILCVKYIWIWQKDWKDRISFYTAIISSIGTFYFIYSMLLVWTYFDTIEKYPYLYIFLFAFLIYISIWILYTLYNLTITFIKWWNFLKAGPVFFGLLLLLYFYWFLIDYLFASIL